jgi:hypothetical protein
MVLCYGFPTKLTQENVSVFKVNLGVETGEGDGG